MRSSVFIKILVGCCLAVPVWAQSARTYLVTGTGDTLYTAVRFNTRLADNNREVTAFVNGQSVRYTPDQLKGYYNGLQEFETQLVGEVPVFLQRHTAGHVSLYYCDETVLGELIRHYPRLGDQIGYSLGDALGAALKSVKEGSYFGGKVPIMSGSDKAFRVFDPTLRRRKQELADYFYDFPGSESLLSQETITPETYEQLVMAYNQWRPQAMARLMEQEKKANGF